MTESALHQRRQAHVKHGAYACDVYSARTYIAALDAALVDAGALLDQLSLVDLRQGIDLPHDGG